MNLQIVVFKGSFNQGKILSVSAWFQCTVNVLYALLPLACNYVLNPNQTSSGFIAMVVRDVHDFN